jgi:N-acetylmuramoyl-L-alanine amidase
MVSGLRKKYRKVNNLGVKPAPFVVLIGAQMPAILAEISFISNPVEARRLSDDRYLDSVADQLVTGISKYISHLDMASLRL